MSQSVLTIAVGKPIYIKLAVNLARSFKVWNSDSDIVFILATDRPELIPRDLCDIEVLKLNPGQFGEGFSTKLHLDRLVKTTQTLFIDADCLFVGPIKPIFDRFSGRSVSVVGKPISDGDWYCDAAEILSKFSLKSMPRFNGGLYYLEKGETLSKVYETARELESNYDEIGFKRLRGQTNDEVVMAVSMAVHGQTEMPEDGTIMNSTYAAPAGVEIDVFSGYSKLKNPVSHANHNPWYEQEEMSPKIVHFISPATEKRPYLLEAKKIELVSLYGWSVKRAELWTTLSLSIPLKVVEILKNIFRPLFHQFVGSRAVRKNSRS